MPPPNKKMKEGEVKKAPDGVNGREVDKVSELDSIPDYSKEKELSLLEKLPQELIWDIIEYIPESIRKLRATSSTLRSRVDDFVMRDTTVITEKLCFYKPGGMPMEVLIHIREEDSIVFELRMKLRRAPLGVKSGFGKDEYGRRNRYCSYEFKFDPAIDDDSILSYLGECVLGRRINIMTFENCNVEEAHNVIDKVIEGIKEVDEIVIHSIDFSEEAANHLVKMMKTKNVDFLNMTAEKICTPDPAQVFIELSSYVREFKYKQYLGEGHSSSYFIGVDNFEWGPTIVEMFSRKLEIMTIGNLFHAEYFTMESANTLLEKLPKLKKKIWFETHCNVYQEDLGYKINDYSVAVTAPHDRNCGSLEIKHESYDETEEEM